jgi:putative lipoprotein
MRMIAAVLALLLTLAGPAMAARVTLSGEVTYRERIALPPNGVLTISLIDLEAPAGPRVSAQGKIATPGQVPLSFTLNFEDSVILPNHKYALTSTIAAEDGAIWFLSAEPYPVEPLAPAAPIVLVLNRPAPEATEPPEATETPTVTEEAVLVPEPIAPLPPPILDITWRATSIGGNPVGRLIVSSLSIAQDMRAGGRGGCNSWFAQAELNDTNLLFSAVAATRMACLSDDATAQEDAFFAALAATRRWRLDGDVLTLLDGANATLAVLEKSAF